MATAVDIPPVQLWSSLSDSLSFAMRMLASDAPSYLCIALGVHGAKGWSRLRFSSIGSGTDFGFASSRLGRQALVNSHEAPGWHGRTVFKAFEAILVVSRTVSMFSVISRA